ncbi:MAG: O-methyltransferase [Actinomycetota bacterium]
MNQIEVLESYLEEKQLISCFKRKAEEEKTPVAEDPVCRFLEMVCFLAKPDRILEIGCGCGYASYFLIKNLKGSYTGIDLNLERIKKAKLLLKDTFRDKNINFIGGDALKLVPGLEGKFDLVFIDAAKYQYPDYLKSLMGKVHKNAFIIADNILYKGLVFKKHLSGHHKNSLRGIREYLFLVSNKNNFSTRILDIGDGISVSEVLV